jgi:FimV-like protein
MKTLKQLGIAVLISTLLTFNPTHSQTTDTYGPIKPGEMLWNIAGKVRPNTTISRYQAMLALLTANPHAFDIHCNINSLKIGEILRIPSGSDMQAMTHNNAVKAFNRQSQEWKAYRLQKQEIICPPLPKEEAAQAQKVPVIEAPEKPLPVITQNTNSTASTATIAPTEIAPQKTTLSEPITSESYLKEIQAWVNMPLSSLIVIGLLILSIIILFILLIRQRRRSPTKKEFMPDNHFLANQGEEHKSLPRQEQEIKRPNRIPAYFPETRHDGVASNPNAHEMKDKLERVRAYLAENEAQTAQNMLREVIQKGTTEQQEEAKQLYEINKKMNFLKQSVAKDKQMSLSHSPQSDVWQEIVHQNKQWPSQQYLPENREQVFDLIDKIFELLDYELNAQGQLIEAYVNRHQQEVVKSPNYEIVEKPEKVEKVLINEEEELPLRQPQSESKPTRYL